MAVPWPVSYAACSTCAPFEGMSADDKAMFERMATDYLWNWTLKAFGVFEATVRPCREDCEPSSFWGLGPFTTGSVGRSLYGIGATGLSTFLTSQGWVSFYCGRCSGDSCSCGVPSSLRLPGPVVSVSEVLLDGDVLDPSLYRVDNHALLVRTDGLSWPTCQDMALPVTEVGTWQITYDWGREVPVGGQVAAGVLACELAKAACRDSSCALPQRVQTITRQGVTVAMIDAFDGIEAGHTGIWIIDSWVASIVKPVRPGRVYSVDVPRPKWRRTS